MFFSEQSIAIVIALSSILCFCSCSDERARPVSSPVPELIAPVIGLPQLPVDRSVADLTEYLLDGTATFQRSSNVSEDGTTILLNSTTAVPAWAIYGFDPLGNPLDSFHISLSVPAGSSAWLALADYSRGRWDIRGSLDESSTVVVESELHLSPQGILYVAVIAQGAAPSTVSAASVRTINPNNTAPTADLSATPLSGNTPLSVAFDASGSSDTEDNIARYLWDFDGDGFFEGQSSEPTASFTFVNGGTFQAAVRVEDSEGAATEDTLAIDVNASPTVVLQIFPATATLGEEVFLDGSQSSDSDGTLETFQWDADGDGVFEQFDGASITIRPAVAGAHSLSLRLTDDDGAATVGSALIHVHGFLEREEIAAPGLYTTMLLVSGIPAICYYGNNDGNLYFVRALSSEGSEWNQPVVVDGSGFAGAENSMAIVDGHPAISYVSFEAQDLRYVRSIDPFGNSWGFAEILDNGEFGFSSLAVVADRPAVAYYDWDNKELLFVRADDIDGNTWFEPQTIDTATDTGFSASLAVVEGNPAIAYHDLFAASLRYIRATSSDGSAWEDPPLTVDGSTAVGYPCVLRFVAGRPSIAYYASTIGELRYVRAADPWGFTWQDALSVDSQGAPGIFLSLEIIDGKPGIAYFDEIENTVQYVSGLNAAGTAWASPVDADVTPSEGRLGTYCSLIDLNGHPAIACVDEDEEMVCFTTTF